MGSQDQVVGFTVGFQKLFTGLHGLLGVKINPAFPVRVETLQGAVNQVTAQHGALSF